MISAKNTEFFREYMERVNWFYVTHPIDGFQKRRGKLEKKADKAVNLHTPHDPDWECAEEHSIFIKKTEDGSITFILGWEEGSYFTHVSVELDHDEDYNKENIANDITKEFTKEALENLYADCVYIHNGIEKEKEFLQNYNKDVEKDIDQMLKDYPEKALFYKYKYLAMIYSKNL